MTYRLESAGSGSDAAARAAGIALEQTVEVPAAAVRDPFVAEHVVGQVESVVEADAGAVLATIAYAVDTTACDPAQLLNVVFGMTSLQADARCVDVVLPGALLEALRGPRFGAAGLREILGTPKRPLTCTAVKPMGLGPDALADLLRDFARAGIDVIKDDQGLADHPFCPFEPRVRACLAAAEAVAQETGQLALYVPNLVGTPRRVVEQLRIAEDLGARAVMVSPLLIGLPAFWELCHEHASVPVLAHPSFGGAQRFGRALLFGRLLRAYGADAVIFVSYGGRYGVPRPECRELAANLREPLGGLRGALPVPGGGIQLDEVGERVAFYGDEVMLLVGGSLQIEAGRIFERSRAFVEALHASQQ